MKKTIYKYDLKHMYASTPNTTRDNTLNLYNYLTYNEKLICDTMDSEYNRIQAQQEVETKKQSIASNKIYDFSKVVNIDSNNSKPVYDKSLLEKMYKALFKECKYTNQFYDNYIDFINAIYQPITRCIIKSMANSQRSMNYSACRQIVNNNYVDNLTDDLYNVCYLTMYINLKLLNGSIPVYDFKTVLLNNTCNLLIYDSKNDGYKECENINLFLACYKAISGYLYNQKTRCENVAIMSIYDSDTQQENEYKLDSYAFKQALINNEISNSQKDTMYYLEKWYNAILEYIQQTEKPHIYEKCKNVLKCMFLGYINKDIIKITGYSKDSVAKYKTICVNALHALQQTDSEPQQTDTKQHIDTIHKYGIITIDKNKKYNKPNYQDIVLSDTYFMDYTDYIESIYKRNKLKYNTLKSIKQDNIKSMRMDTYLY